MKLMLRVARARGRFWALAAALGVSVACGGEDSGTPEDPATEGPSGGDGGTSPPSSADGSAPSGDASTGDSGVDSGADGGAAEVFSGEATYYNATGTGACGQATQDSALVAALNGAQYSKANCGRCASIKGPNGTVVVKLLDKCPGCSFGDIDLSTTAFSKIAKLSAGRVKITWSFVACP